MNKKISMLLLASVLLPGAVQPCHAALQAVGPVSPATGYFPFWYQDATTTLELCLSQTPSPDPAAAGAPMCLLPLEAVPGVYDPALPIVFPLNFPDEVFWFSADANIVDAGAGVDLRYVAHLEGAFGTGLVLNGDQISFGRIRFFVQLPTPGTYMITHPYGVDTFVVNTIDPAQREIQFTRDIGIGAPGVFTGALASNIGPFLVKADALGNPTPIVIGTETFIGDPNVLQTVTGSPFGINYVRIQGPGIDLQTDQLAISGKLFNGVLPPPLTVDRTTYSRTAAGVTQVEAFATSAPDATVTFRETVAAGGETPMSGDPVTGGFFEQYAPVAKPANLIVSATQAGTPTASLVSPVIDRVTVNKVTFSPVTKKLTILAASSDQLAPLPELTALGWGKLAPTAPGATTQRLIVTNVAEPPAQVTVKSSAGGVQSEPVVILAPPPPPPPLAGLNNP